MSIQEGVKVICLPFNGKPFIGIVVAKVDDGFVVQESMQDGVFCLTEDRLIGVNPVI